MAFSFLKDANWVRQSFLVNKADLDTVDQQNRIYSSASAKFTDTTLGGNFAINPAPQFTNFADIKNKGRYSASQGMGRYYSEAMDDNQQLIYMRFGVPTFNSLTTFFTSFYDSGTSQLAKTGRNGGFFFTLGKAAIAVVAADIIGIVTLIQLLGLAFRFYANKPASKFYYLKPTMPLYWGAVQTIVNRLAVNRGIIPSPTWAGDEPLPTVPPSVANPQTYAKLMPNLFNSTGGINVYSMAGRAQRLARVQSAMIDAAVLAGGNLSSLQTNIQDILSNPINDNDKKKTYQEYLANWFGNDITSPVTSGSNTAGSLAATQAANSTNTTPATPPTTKPSGDGAESAGEKTPSFWEFFLSELDDGSAFACFRVNATGHMSESFSNSVVDSELAGKINGMSSQSRSTKFDFAGGNIVGGAIGETLGKATSAVEDFVAGGVAMLEMSGLASLAGSAFVDIPKHWQSSMASLPRANYTISLVSPYGNPISQMMNLDVPLAMLLAAALPMATGKQSYTSPFICELYDQGRCQTRLGMIDSLSITRGTGNLGFTNSAQGANALGIDVSFSVVDMSSIMYMPIAESFSHEGLFSGAAVGAGAGAIAAAIAAPGNLVIKAAAGATGAAAGAVGGGAVGAAIDFAGNTINTINSVFSDDSAFTDYMAVLAGMPLRTQIYSSQKMKYNITNAIAQWKTFYSNAALASWAGSTFPAHLSSHLFRGVARELPK